jgi:RHS repeat-associated protein/uncharacterized repeat protein (TIGR01451 family)
VDTLGAPASPPAYTSLAYDARGFLTSIIYPDGKGFTFEYNAAGRRTRRVGHDGYTLNYGYDSVGRLETLTDGASRELVRYAYSAAGRLSRETKANGTFTTYTYDLAGQLTALTNYASPTTVNSFFNYTYDAKGNRLTMTTAAGVTSYDYDALNQLTGVTYPGGRHVTYAYDAAGNRVLMNDTGVNTAYTANALNQYTTVGDEVLFYDADGNLTNRHSTLNPQLSTSYFYDTENRLVRVATPTNGVFQYTYDALGNRTAVVHNGVTNRFLHDPVGLVDLAAEYDATDALVARYDHAIGLVSRTDGAGSAFYSFDALGNTRELTGDAGAVVNSYDYDAFGVATMANETVANNYRFVGKFGVTDVGLLGLQFMRARYYSPSTGRFLATDPLGFYGDDVNLYRYVGNNAVNAIDPEANKRFIQYLSGAANEIGDLLLRRVFVHGEFGGYYRDAVSKGVRVGSPYYNSLGRQQQTWVRHDWGMYAIGTGHPSDAWKREAWPVHGEALLSTAQNVGSWFIDQANLIGNWMDSQLDSLMETFASVVRPIDPNDKIGPNGVGPNRVVSAQDEIEYMVRFENFASASAPVQELIVVDYLDAGLDWTTVRFKEIAYGDRIVTPPVGSQSFTVRDQPPANSPSVTGSAVSHMVIDVHGSVNPQTGRMEWRMTCLDTNTGIWPLDALSGFLPPENGTGRGQGYVKLGVRPKNNLPIGTAITNIASIVFDGNDPIATPPVWNIIGDVPSLAATIAYVPGQITAGMPFTYTIGLTNSGTNLVENVILTNALPTGVTVVNATATLGTVSVTNGALVWDLGTLANGTGVTLTITATATEAGTFTNTLYYSGGSGLAIFSSPTEIVVAPSTPRLGIRIVSGKLVLFWSTNQAGFHLQRAAAVVSASWNDVTSAPVIVGQEYQVTLDLPSAPAFFRLAKVTGNGTSAPQLRIRTVAGGVFLFWPTNAAGFHLQNAPALPAPGGWSDFSNTPAIVGQEYRMQVSPSNATGFYRLLKP